MSMIPEVNTPKGQVSPRLTIAIPTWNRHDRLLKTVEAIVPQLFPDACLLIVDNASDVPVAETLVDYADRLAPSIFRIVRNVVNIGGEPNFLRCIEHCDTEWVWLLGDDDIPREDAVKTILSHLERHPDATYINFSGPIVKRSKFIISKGQNNLIDKFDSFGELQWMSVNIYRASAAKSVIRYCFSHSCSSLTFVLAFFTVGSDGEFVLSPHEIIAQDTPPEWSQIQFLMSVGLVLSLPLTPHGRRRVIDKLYMLSPIRLPRDLFYALPTHFGFDDIDTILYYYDQINARCCWYRFGVSVQLEQTVVRFLLRFPRISHGVFRAFHRLIGRKHPKLNNLAPLDHRL